MAKLNQEFPPAKYKLVEEYLRENIEKVTIDDLEKKILDVERAEEENRKRAVVKDYQNESSSEDSIDGPVSILTKKDSLNLKQLFEKQFVSKTKPEDSAEPRKQPAKEPTKVKSERPPSEQQTIEKPKDVPKSESAAVEKPPSFSASKEPGKEESSVKVEEGAELVDATTVQQPSSKRDAKSVDDQATKSGIHSKSDAKTDSGSDSGSDLKAVDSLQVTNFETTKIDLYSSGSSKAEQKKTPTDISFSSYLSSSKSADYPQTDAQNEPQNDLQNAVTSPSKLKSKSSGCFAFFPKISNVKSLLKIKEPKSNISDSKSLEMPASTLTNPLPDAKLVDKKDPGLAKPKNGGNGSTNPKDGEIAEANPKNNGKDQAVEKIKSDSKSLKLASTTSDDSGASRITLKMLNFMDAKDKEVKSISQYIDPKEMAKLDARLRELKAPVRTDQPGKPNNAKEDKLNATPPFDTLHPNLNPNVNLTTFAKLNLGTSTTPPESPNQSMNQSLNSVATEENETNTLTLKDQKNLLEPKVKTESNLDIGPKVETVPNVNAEPKVETLVKPEAKVKPDETFSLLERLPMKVLKLLFSLLKNSDIISFINAHRKCYNLTTEILKEIVVVSQRFNSNEPFLLNLFHTREHVSHENVITDGRILNLQNKDYRLQISSQIRKLVTNEISKSIEAFANLEQLEIVEPNETILCHSSTETGFALNLKHLKILSLSTVERGLSFVFSVMAPNLTAVRLVNFRLLRLSNYESVHCLDVDEYDKFVNKFPNLQQLHCTNLNFLNGLLKKNSQLRLIRLVHVERDVLVHLLKRKKVCKLMRLRIVVQGIRVDGMNQTTIMRELTTFYGEMRIYLKYQHRLMTLDFLTSLVVNFDLKCLNKSLLKKLTNLKNIEVNFGPSHPQRWLQLLRASKVLSSISINVPIAQAFLDLLPEGCPNCIHLNLLYSYYPEKFNLKFVSAFPYLISIKINKELTVGQVATILQYRRLKFFKEIKFYCGREQLEIGYNRATSIVALGYQNRKILMNKQDFRKQLLLAGDWSWFYRNSNFPAKETDQKSLHSSSTS